MPNPSQAERPLRITTPLDKDVLLITGLSAQEAISQLFSFRLDLLAENKHTVPFESLLGQKITVELALPEGKVRYFNGICSRISQADRDPLYTTYRAEIVPQFWLLTRRAQSRTFQHLSVPEILKKVLQGLDVSFEIQGTFHPRDFCVQYRETDFNFASRLMEEEGIFYFFKHSAKSHTMVIGNTQPTHPEVPGASKVIFELGEGGLRKDDRIDQWEKTQELRSGKSTLWDHCFELPHKHLEADKTIVDSIEAGTVTHKLKVGGNDKLELYDYPGEYAGRFDGVNAGGGEQPAEVQKIFEDNKRTVEIRMQQEALPSMEIRGSSLCRQFIAGHRFTLERHFNANGAYLLTSVTHFANLNDFRSGDNTMRYENHFTCIPTALPFRPLRVTPRPTVQGAQTAVVVGPPGEEIFTDKYGRVKVQFHWDRQGKNDADSSCWLRVATLWAGKQWGVIHIPRIGQEVLVDFLEGNPNDPVIVGSVYNAETMPPYVLPANKTQSGVKSRSSLGGSPANFNQIRFEDKKDAEQILIHAEKNQDIEVENDETHSVGHDRTKTIERDETTRVKRHRTETVDKNETISIGDNRTESVGKDEKITIGANRTESVGKDEKIMIGGDRTESVAKDEALSIKGSQSKTVGKDESVDVGKNFSLKAGDQISLVCGDASITMKKDGTILIEGKDIGITGSGKITAKAASDVVVKGSKVNLN